MRDKAIELFDKIVRPAMNDCSLSLPDYRIIQGAVMQALYAAELRHAADADSVCCHAPIIFGIRPGEPNLCSVCGGAADGER